MTFRQKFDSLFAKYEQMTKELANQDNLIFNNGSGFQDIDEIQKKLKLVDQIKDLADQIKDHLKAMNEIHLKVSINEINIDEEIT